jgi:hypothetical protein
MEIQVQRKEVFDPSTTKYEREELPTVTIKDAARDVRLASGSALLTCTALGGGTELRITALRVASGTHAGVEFFLSDRDGTFAYPYLAAAGQESLHGAPNEPLHVVRGTFTIGVVTTPGSVDTISASYEGIVRFAGTETWN